MPMRLLLGFTTAWVVLYALFQTFPTIDTGFSSLFCVSGDASNACSVFVARGHWLAVTFRQLFFWAPVAALALMLGDIGYQLFSKARADRERVRFEVLAIAAYLVGPILVVNGILKSFSGRPRPLDTEFFGGAFNFVPVGDFTGACMSNCSFVSGEAAAAGWMLCLALWIQGRFRKALIAALVTVSVVASLLRVVMGAHFLSDVMLGWLIGAASLPALVALSFVLPRRHIRNT